MDLTLLVALWATRTRWTPLTLRTSGSLLSLWTGGSDGTLRSVSTINAVDTISPSWSDRPTRTTLAGYATRTLWTRRARHSLYPLRPCWTYDGFPASRGYRIGATVRRGWSILTFQELLALCLDSVAEFAHRSGCLLARILLAVECEQKPGTGTYYPGHDNSKDQEEDAVTLALGLKSLESKLGF